ncbi:MAG: methyltransferase domain-containing protein [Pseudonocardia sp.]|nr:methyltransferase domain-containing protein [Pseudonocardia sp.]
MSANQLTTADVAAFYDRTNELLTRYFGGSMHYGYWDGPNDAATFAEASVRFTDMMIATLRAGAARQILDVGCGTGRPTIQLARSTGAQVVGVSISAHDVELATELAAAEGMTDQVSFRQADAMELPFPAGSFDAAWAFESLGHVPDRSQVLAEIARVLRPGGRLALSDAFERVPVEEEIRTDFDGVMAAWRAVDLVDRATYERIVTEAGFTLDALTDVSDHIVYSYPRIFRSLMHDRDTEPDFPEELADLAAAYEKMAPHSRATVASSGYLTIGAARTG